MLVGHVETAISYFYFLNLGQIRNQHLQKSLITKYQDYVG